MRFMNVIPRLTTLVSSEPWESHKEENSFCNKGIATSQ